MSVFCFSACGASVQTDGSGGAGENSPEVIGCTVNAGCDGGEDDQYVDVAIRFDRNVRYSSGLAADLRIVIGGGSVTTPSQPAQSEQVVAQSYTVRSYNDSRAEDDQNVEVKIKFSAPVKVLSGAEKDLIVKIAGNTLDKTPNASDGVSTRTLSVKADPSDSTSVIVTIGSVKGSKFIRMTNAKLEIEAAER